MNRWAFLFLLLALLSPAQAADAVFPPGSRIGLTPPPGISPSHNFQGFEDAANSVAVVIAALPREAHWDLRRSTSAEELKKRGMTFEKREEQKLDAGDASLVIARQEVDKVKLRKWIFSVLAPMASPATRPMRFDGRARGSGVGRPVTMWRAATQSFRNASLSHAPPRQDCGRARAAQRRARSASTAPSSRHDGTRQALRLAERAGGVRPGSGRARRPIRQPHPLARRSAASEREVR